MPDFNNDVAAFNALFNKHKEPFTLFAKSYVRDIMIAEDIYMESMLQFWEKMQDLPNDTNIPAYILTIVRNASINYLRHQLVVQNMQDKVADIHQREIEMNISSLEACNPAELFASDIQEIVTVTLNKMSSTAREVFRLSRYGRLTNKEIACRLQISEKGVEYHISKVLRLLKIALKDYLPFFFLLMY